MQKEQSVLYSAFPKNLLSVREEGRECKGEVFILKERVIASWEMDQYVSK